MNENNDPRNRVCFEWHNKSQPQNESPNAPDVRDVVGTTVLAIVCGFTRYVHINRLRNDLVFFAATSVTAGTRTCARRKSADSCTCSRSGVRRRFLRSYANTRTRENGSMPEKDGRRWRSASGLEDGRSPVAASFSADHQKMSSASSWRVHETNFRNCGAVGLQSLLGVDNPRGVPQMAGRESREGPASGAARDYRLKLFYLTYASPSRMKTLVDIFEERDINMSIYLRSRYIGVPEKFLNSADVGAALKKM